MHWVDFCSAKELVRSWFRTGTAAVPEEFMGILRQAFGTELWFSEAVPECIVQSDKFRDEQRNCDLMLYGFGLHKPLV